MATASPYTLPVYLSVGCIPAKRIYYGKLSMTTIVILHGGDKDDSDQDKDIAIAQERWADYRQRLAQPAT